jgi:hypothetical protein
LAELRKVRSMAIAYAKTRLSTALRAKADVLVLPVHCSGALGSGLALEASSLFPSLKAAYVAACLGKKLVPGTCLPVTLAAKGELAIGPQAIALFATRLGPGLPTMVSKRVRADVATAALGSGAPVMADHTTDALLRAGLVSLVALVQAQRWTSLSLPPLGCRAREPEWGAVRRMLEDAFAALPDVQVTAYEPTWSGTSAEPTTKANAPLKANQEAGEPRHG